MTKAYVYDRGPLSGEEFRFIIELGAEYPMGESIAEFARREDAELFVCALNGGDRKNEDVIDLIDRLELHHPSLEESFNWAELKQVLENPNTVLMPRKCSLDMSIAFAEVWFSKVRAIDDDDMQDAYDALINAAKEQE